MSQSKKVIVAYGFEYDALIGSPDNLILCKCFESGNPFYASPHYIESTDIKYINEKIKEIEEINSLNKVNIYSKKRNLSDFTPCSPCWRTVIYYDNIKFNHLNIGYESEGDENGDGR